MYSFDVVDLYNQGFSIDYIIKAYYRYKNKDCKRIEKRNDCIIIHNKLITKQEARNYVYEVLYKHFIWILTRIF